MKSVRDRRGGSRSRIALALPLFPSEDRLGEFLGDEDSPCDHDE